MVELDEEKFESLCLDCSALVSTVPLKKLYILFLKNWSAMVKAYV
jgi:hypothetical protein